AEVAAVDGGGVHGHVTQLSVEPGDPLAGEAGAALLVRRGRLAGAELEQRARRDELALTLEAVGEVEAGPELRVELEALGKRRARRVDVAGVDQLVAVVEQLGRGPCVG